MKIDYAVLEKGPRSFFVMDCYAQHNGIPCYEITSERFRYLGDAVKEANECKKEQEKQEACSTPKAVKA